MSAKSRVSPPGSARLFTEAHPSAPPPAGVHVANIDGASRGNPGPASYAVVLRDPSGKVIVELAKNIGRETNNVAEYYALLAALDAAAANGITALRIRSDSELLVRQMQGRYKVKSPELKPLHERASKLSRQFAYFNIEHVPREMNRDADGLANVALDQAGTPKFEHKGSTSDPRATADPREHAQPAAKLMSHTRRIRARFIKGTFTPLEAVDLAEGTEVSLEVHIPLKH